MESRSISGAGVTLSLKGGTFAPYGLVVIVFGTSYTDVGGGERRTFLLVGDEGGLMSLLRFGGLGKL